MILDTIQVTDKKLLYFKLTKLGQNLRVDKTCFPRPGHIYIYIYAIVSKLYSPLLISCPHSTGIISDK